LSERLVIRLNSHADDEIHWLQYNDKAQETIASGCLNNASELGQLTELAKTAAVQVLVSGCDVSYFEMTLPKANRRQAFDAIPFMLEDELAADIDTLHFVYSAGKGETQGVYVCAKSKIREWLNWLSNANIFAAQFVPDYLALPVSEDNSISMLQLGNDLLIRTSITNGLTIDGEWIDIALPRLAQDNELLIEHYGVDEAHQIESYTWTEQQLVPPMEQLARGLVKLPINILVGDFEQNKQQHDYFKIWRPVAIAVSLLIVLFFTQQLVRVNQIEDRIAVLKKQSAAIYKKINPNVKRVIRIKSRMTNELKELAGGSEASELNNMLVSLQTAFVSVPKLTPINIKYDQRRQELRLQAEGDSYQIFENFKKQLDDQYNITMGAMNNNGDKVNGSLVIKASS